MQNPFTYIWRKKWLLAIVVLAVIVVIWIVFAATRKPSYQFVTVQRGPITEIVSVTGNTTSTQDVSLAFQVGGTIAAIYAQLGTQVAAGQTLVGLDTSDLQAQLAQAEAAVDAQQAELDTLTVGPRPENIAVAQTALTAAEQNLTNAYAGVPNTLVDADNKAVDAVVNQLAPFFNNPQTSNPQLTFGISDSQLLNNIQTQRALASQALAQWQGELGALGAAQSPSALDQMLQNAQIHIGAAQQLFDQAAQALTDTTSLSPTTAATYKTVATTGAGELNVAATEVTTAVQTVAAQKAAVAQAQAQLNLAAASSTPETIAAQKAQLEQAQANVESAEANLRQASLVAPISGIVTEQNAKAGQIASPGVPLVSILGSNGFEVDVYVPEVDIGKVNTGDSVAMTFDTFPGETFEGKVFYSLGRSGLSCEGLVPETGPAREERPHCEL
jgi:multidrug resistance efflux pump